MKFKKVYRSWIQTTHHTHWKGINNNGQYCQGVGAHPSMYFIVKEQSRTEIHVKFIKKITLKNVYAFTFKLSNLITHQIPITDALKFIGKNTSHHDFQKVIKKIILSIKAGQPLSMSLRQFPNLFNDEYCHMVYAGECCGELASALEKLTGLIEKQLKMRQKIKKALSYPLTVLGIAATISMGLFIFVVPQLQSLFNHFNTPLPAFTLVLLILSHFLQHNAFWVLTSISLMALLAHTLYQKIPIIKITCSKYVIHIPYINTFISMTETARFTKTLALLLDTGVSFSHALPIAISSIGNLHLRNQCQQAQMAIFQGQSLSQALRLTQLLSPAWLQLIALGEYAGQLSILLSQINREAEAALDQRLDHLSKWLEPVIILFIAIFVGSVVLAMYLPIFKIGMLA